MGSRRGRNAALAGLAVSLAGCSVGAPTGFSAGEHWVMPLVGPLENGVLIVPGYVHGKGPYLFAIDPDERFSSLDEDVIKAAGLNTGEGPHLLDESDTEHPSFVAEVRDLQLGTLTVTRSEANAVRPGVLEREGRKVQGVLGRNIIADSLVFGFDRDLGVITLGTQKSFHAEGTPVPFEILDSKIENVDVVPAPLRLVSVQLGGKRVQMNIALGRVASELRPRSLPAAGVSDVTVGSLQAEAVPFIGYRDRRWDDQYVEGNLSLSFFKHYAVTANWDKNTIYVRPRAEQPVATRIGRWQSKTLSSCEHAGCATVSMIDPLAGKTPEGPHPGLVVSVARDASSLQTPLEVVIAVSGKPGLPWLIASLPAGVDRAMTHVPADYIGATATVVDASPFPRECPAAGAGCIDKLAAP